MSVMPFRDQSIAARLAAAEAEHRAREQRIEAFTVTRTHIKTGKALTLSPEFEVGEERAREWRGHANRSEQLAAWKRFFRPRRWWSR